MRCARDWAYWFRLLSRFFSCSSFAHRIFFLSPLKCKSKKKWKFWIGSIYRMGWLWWWWCYMVLNVVFHSNRTPSEVIAFNYLKECMLFLPKVHKNNFIAMLLMMMCGNFLFSTKIKLNNNNLKQLTGRLICPSFLWSPSIWNVYSFFLIDRQWPNHRGRKGNISL